MDWKTNGIEIITLILVLAGIIISFFKYKVQREELVKGLNEIVISNQFKFYEEIISFAEEFPLSQHLDYETIVRLNGSVLMREHNIILKDNDQDYASLLKNGTINGWRQGNINRNQPYFVIRTETIDNTSNSNNQIALEHFRAKNQLDAQNGIVNIDFIWLTEKHMQFLTKLNNHINNPLMPETIREALEHLQNEIDINFNEKLIGVLEEFILNYFEKDKINKSEHKIDWLALWHSFNHKRIMHKESIEGIQIALREYFVKDKKLR